MIAIRKEVDLVISSMLERERDFFGVLIKVTDFEEVISSVHYEV